MLEPSGKIHFIDMREYVNSDLQQNIQDGELCQGETILEAAYRYQTALIKALLYDY